MSQHSTGNTEKGKKTPSLPITIPSQRLYPAGNVRPSELEGKVDPLSDLYAETAEAAEERMALLSARMMAADRAANARKAAQASLVSVPTTQRSTDGTKKTGQAGSSRLAPKTNEGSSRFAPR